MADADHDFGGGFAPLQQQGDAGARVSVPWRRYVNLAGALTSLGLVVGLGIWGYQLAMRDIRGVPVILALEGPMRVAPADPGGEIVEYQGLSVNDVAADGAATPIPDRLILAPRPVDLTDEDQPGLAGPAGTGTPAAPALDGTGAEAPVLAADPLDESATPTAVAVDAALAEALGEPVAEEEPLADADLPDLVGDTAPAVATAPLPEGTITASPRPRARPESGANSTAAVATEAVTMQFVQEIDPATIPAGTRLVQFGAFDSAEKARAEWARLSGQFGEVMAGKSMVVQPAESGGRTFYRLRAHGFDGEDDARRFCAAFVAGGATCIPVPQR